jgi:hypothetical protein
MYLNPGGWVMVVLEVLGGAFAMMLSLAFWYDHRQRRRGSRVNVSTEEALNSRLDIESVDNPFLAGGKQDWMTHRQRDRK